MENGKYHTNPTVERRLKQNANTKAKKALKATS